MPGDNEFAVDVEDGGLGGTVVAVSGELDMATSPELEAVLVSTSARGKVVIDLTKCEFIDSTALGVLLAEASRVENAGGSCVIVAPDRGIRRVLELAGVDTRLPIYMTREAAL